MVLQTPLEWRALARALTDGAAAPMLREATCGPLGPQVAGRGINRWSTEPWPALHD